MANMPFDITIQVVRSSRKTLCLTVDRAGVVIVKAPFFTPQERIRAFVEEHRDWIAEKRSKALAHAERFAVSAEREKALKELAKKILPQKTAYYAARMNVEPRSIRITSAAARYGSCSADHRICYSWRVMLLPEELIDYIVVHELAHIKEHNHSKAFYRIIERELPDYRKRVALLRSM